MKPTLAFVLRAALVTALYAAASLGGIAFLEDVTDCETDTECSAHCPPPNDDPDCDGGPQS